MIERPQGLRVLVSRHLSHSLTAVVCVALAVAATAARAGEFEPPIAVTDVRIVTEPGRVIEKGAIVIDDGHIVAVGEDAAIPPHAQRIDGKGLVAYAGFIDACTHAGIRSGDPDDAELARLQDEAPNLAEAPATSMFAANRNRLTPHWRAVERFDAGGKVLDKHRQAGFTAALVAPHSAIIGGKSMVMTLGDSPLRRSVLREDVFMHAGLAQPDRGSFFARREGASANRENYPGTLMGVMAHFRQAMHDSEWYLDVHAYASRHPEMWPRPPFDVVLDALNTARRSDTPFVFHVNSDRDILRAKKLADEFSLPLMIAGARDAWRVVDVINAVDIPLMVSLKFPDEPAKVDKDEPSADTQPASQPATLPATQPTAESTTAPATTSAPAPTTQPIDDDAWEKLDFEPEAVRRERRRLWEEEELDNLVRLHKAGVPFSIASYEMESPGDVLKQLRKVIERGLPADVALAALTTAPADLLGVSDKLGRIEVGKLANLTLLTGNLEDEKSNVAMVFVDGEKFEFDADRKGGGSDRDRPGRGRGRSGRGRGGADRPERDPEERETEEDTPESDELVAEAPTTSSAPADDAEDATTTATSAPVETGPQTVKPNVDWPFETDADRLGYPDTQRNVLLQNATVVTVSDGTLAETDVLIRDGRIAEIGKNIAVPDGVTAIDLTGYFVSPGIIDPHSHICSDGGLNEGTMSITPEVNVYDVIDNRDLAMFRALAGGVTTVLTLHGSANTIGGQSAVIKLKYHRPVDDLPVEGAPQPVKFALGENVKRSNSTREQTRYPGTRMGVESTLRRALLRADQYRAEWKAYRDAVAAGKDAVPPRKDLRLEALAGVLDGRIWVNCHCYRADEILRLLAIAESFGFRIAVLQHVLEGYRVIPEIVRHGCGASTFSDWWAYKIEAYEAVPQNAGMMIKGGVCATINSDSAEVIRHLPLEAAKSVRFMGLDENEAMRLCTLNGAIQLGIDSRVGSIDVGKDGDIAVFDGHPLDTFSKCVLTLIEGEIFFQHRDFDLEEPQQPDREPMAVPKHHDPLPAPGPSPDRMYAIVNATVHPVSGPPIENATVRVTDGKIDRVGTNVPLRKGDAVINAKGLHVYPGLIDAGADHGLDEIGQIRATRDAREIATFSPELRAEWAVHPSSSQIAVSRCEGVTTALAMPAGGAISGQASFINLNGWTMPEMLVESGVALRVDLPTLPINMPEENRKERVDRHKESMKEINAYFERAARYAEARAAAESDASLAPDEDLELDAMVPYVRGEKPVIFNASSQKQILEAVRFADKHKLEPVIFGGAEAWKCAETLAEFDVPVIVATPMSYPGDRFERWDAVYSNAAVLDDAGVRFCFATGNSTLSKNIGVNAGMAIAHGLDPDTAVRAMTLSAAEILGVDDRLGSLDPGKAANLIVTTGHPCQATTQVLLVMIDGKPTEMSSKHTVNASRYGNRPAPDLPPPTDLVGPPRISGK